MKCIFGKYSPCQNFDSLHYFSFHERKSISISIVISYIMLFFLLSLYPLYKTSECIRGWNRIKKEHFQHWLTFWFCYLICQYIHTIISYTWPLHYLIFLYNWGCILFLLFCHIPNGTIQMRKYVLLPLFRDVKKVFIRVYPYVILYFYPWFEMVYHYLRLLIIHLVTKFK